MNETMTLLPCPFCGGRCTITKGSATEAVWPYGEFHRVFCTACQARQLFYKSAAEAIAAWNTRTHHAERIKADERAKGRIDFKGMWNTMSDRAATNPPAQAAQSVWLDEQGIPHGKVSDEQIIAVLSNAIAVCEKRSGLTDATHPHSPDAADSGRVTDEVVDAAWAALDAALNGKVDGQEYAYGDPFPMRHALEAALATQPQSAASPVGVPESRGY